MKANIADPPWHGCSGGRRRRRRRKRRRRRRKVYSKLTQ